MGLGAGGAGGAPTQAQLLAVLNGTLAQATLLDPITDLSVGSDYADGSLPDGTYYLVLVGVDGNGNSTVPSNEVSVDAVDGVSDFALLATPIAGAVAYRLYYGSTPGGQTHYQVQDAPGLTEDVTNIYFWTLADAVAGTPPSMGLAQRLALSTSGDLSGNLVGLSRTAYGGTYFRKTNNEDGSTGIGGDFAAIVAERFLNAGASVNLATAIVGNFTVQADYDGSLNHGSGAEISGNAYHAGSLGAGLYVNYLTSHIGAAVTGGPVRGAWHQLSVDEGGAVGDYWGHSVAAPVVHDAAQIARPVAFYSESFAGAGVNPYYAWYDSRGVRRVKEDSTFDSVGQAIEALYNPQFAKYTAGAVDYERIVLGQWNGNVAEIGAEKGGTGTLRSLRLIGAGVMFPLVDPHMAGAWWDNGTTLIRSAG